MPVRWVADGGAGEVLALDAQDLPVRRVAVAGARALASRPGGGCWVLGAGEEGKSRLARIEPEGEIVSVATLGAARALVGTADGAAILIEETPAGRGIVRLEGDGRRTAIAELAGAACLAIAGSDLLAGRDPGGLVLWRLAPAPEAVRGWGLARRRIVQVAPGPRPGWWWALERAEGGGEAAAETLHLVDDALAPRWSWTVGPGAAVLAPVPGTESLWVAGGRAPFVRRIGPGGAELEVPDLPLRGIAAGLAAADGGVAWCAPGALLHLDCDGRLRRTQGGFASLRAIAAVFE
ncbi:MAG: hypothetical protein AB1726_08005 [Planctomycetota bacterium]